MVNLKLLIAALALCGYGASHAGYAQLAAPETWQKTATNTLIRVAANDASFPGGIRAGFASFNTGASFVKIPAAYRFAANAGKFAAAAAFGWPSAFLLAGGIAYSWYTDNGLVVNDGVWNKKIDGVICASDCFQYRSSFNLPSFRYSPWYYTPREAIEWYAAAYKAVNSGYTVSVTTCDANGCNFAKYETWRGPSYTTTSYITASKQSVSPYDLSTFTPVSQLEFESIMESKPVPFGVPQSWPLPDPMWWSVDPEPVINPSTGDNPLPQPMRVPLGEPVPVPNSNPQKWKTPVVDLVPSPTPDVPWRVDLQPKEILKEDPAPLPQYSPVPVTPPDGQTEAPTEEQIDFCLKNPDVLACAKPELDTPESEPLEDIEKPLTFTPDTGWAGGAGFCPAPRHLPGANVDFEFDMVCDFMTGIRPVVLAVAALVGGMILIGARGGAAE